MTTPPRIEIFRPGRFTAVDGTQVEFTEADLAAVAASYDAAAEPAPLVVGHPHLDAPAYGWVKAVRFEGGKLVADPDRVEPAFAEAVRAGRYGRVSASFYPPKHPQNPRPGGFYLKHVGFLGAAAPAVRGLQPVHFSEAQVEGAVTIDLDPGQEPPMPETADTTTADFAEREAVLDTREAQVTAREEAIAAREREAEEADRLARHGANVSFAEGMIAGGKLKPFGKDKLVGLLDVLEASAVASFGEAGELAPVDVLKEMLTAAEPFVSFGEAAPAEDGKAAAVSFAAPAGFSVDPVSLEVHGRAVAYQAEHAGASYLDAVRAVS